MKYKLKQSQDFKKWITNIKNNSDRNRILARLNRIALGNFGDHKHLYQNLYEMRFFFASGYRVYYTIQHNEVVFLLCGGNKSSQSRDIEKAKKLLQQLEE